MNLISLSFLENYPSLQEAILENFPIGKGQLKKIKIPLKKKVYSKSEFELPIDVVNRGLAGPYYSGPQIKIIEEDQNFIVLNKPPGIHSHPLLYSDNQNCLSFLRQHYSELSLSLFGVHEKNLLYRLDQGTSGVLIYVRDGTNHERLRQNFNLLVKEKVYYFITEGEWQVDQIVSHDISYQGPHQSRAVCSSGNSARAHFKTYKIHRGHTLVRVQLETGLRHQIRAQAQSLGHPILGDQLYGGAGAERLYLHAYSYQVESRQWLAPWPTGFLSFFPELEPKSLDAHE